MGSRKMDRSHVRFASGMLATALLVSATAVAAEPDRSVFVLTSTNDPSSN